MDNGSNQGISVSALKQMVAGSDGRFAKAFAERVRLPLNFAEAMALCTLRKRAATGGLLHRTANKLRVALIGGCSLRPLADLYELFASLASDLELWTGDFDNYIPEILTPESGLYQFKPNLVVLIPSEKRCQYTGRLSDSRESQEQQAHQIVADILKLCATVHTTSGAEIVVANFRLPAAFDPGPLRATCLGSDYAFRKFVNHQLAASLPDYVHLCDVEFLANRLGTLAGEDNRSWFESKQPYAAALMVDVARELGGVTASLRATPKKVLVLDLDNTLWGGVIGDDGLEGIELGTTSARGEAFRAFQQYLLSLSQRGVLLAVASKNNYETAIEPFQRHPEMVLRLEQVASFKANWEPKPDNIRAIANELNLGLDSMVFADDNPAEIEIVRQFVPEVETVLLGDDPSEFVRRLDERRFFEMRALTAEDTARVELYRKEADRRQLMGSSTDMASYLASLEMVANISSFQPIDVPRIAQLINKSNQFNLTTRRRTEGEVQDVLHGSGYGAFTVRLADRFGDHGLIAVVIGKVSGGDFQIDTWLMSCRVLNRQVEEEVLNEIVRLALEAGCERVIGVYIPTAKNGMVAQLYPQLGFELAEESGGTATYCLDAARYAPHATHISVERASYAGSAASARP